MGLIDILRSIVRDKKVVRIDQTTVNNAKQLPLSDKDKEELVMRLTGREKDTYLLLIEGFTQYEVGEQLGITYSTVNIHTSGIYQKLNVNTITELIINYRNIK